MPTENFTRDIRRKHYEFKDHLGNVRITYSDLKNKIAANDFALDLINTTGYYPFGMQMSARTFTNTDAIFSDEGHRYGFNGMEKDDEIKGEGNSYSTPFRNMDPRLGARWWSNDLIVKPWESPYTGFSNNPIIFKDPLGLDPEATIVGYGENDEPIYSAGTSPEVEVCAYCESSDTQSTLVDDALKGIATNKNFNRYKQNPAYGRSTVFGIDDSKAGRMKNGKPVGDWVVRYDRAGSPDYPHVNHNKKLTGLIKDPHTRISKAKLNSLQGAGKLLSKVGKVAKPVAVIMDAGRIIEAVDQEQGNIMGKKVVVVTSEVAGSWVGAAAGAAGGAEGGAIAGAAIGVWFGGVGAVPGAAIGGFIGGLVGGITGGWLGSEAGRLGAEEFYDD